MPKSILAAALVLLLVGLSCQLTAPREPAAPATAAPVLPLPDTATPLSAPTSTPPPAPTLAAPTSTPLPPQPSPTPPPVLDTLRLIFWDVQVSYDPAVWRLASSDYPVLEHRSLSGCQVTEQGPTEPPMNTTPVQLGEVTYAMAELSMSGQTVDWYMAINGPSGPFPGGLPTLLIFVPPAGAEQCRADALAILATMELAGQP